MKQAILKIFTVIAFLTFCIASTIHASPRELICESENTLGFKPSAKRFTQPIDPTGKASIHEPLHFSSYFLAEYVDHGSELFLTVQNGVFHYAHAVVPPKQRVSLTDTVTIPVPPGCVPSWENQCVPQVYSRRVSCWVE